ncbi:MAG: type II 3-dehydroquinate dehydratase [Clostridiales Family XIII bacterium]|jgi:3-dehydroquinate dehydratase-2|nr:type II 3-dehydroquinate dehydratase [Clostridiales Family XIII bacterium]
MRNILVINGPNLNLLGQRNEEFYGSETLDNLEKKLTDYTSDRDIILSFFQSNIEGKIIDEIQKKSHQNIDGIIINAGGYTHTSVAIRDAIEASNIKTVEVHISNISKREEFRHNSLISPVCVGTIFGFGMLGYTLAIDYFLK